MAIRNKYPHIRPSLLLDFDNTFTTDMRVQASRASPINSLDKDYRATVISANKPRLYTDPNSGDCWGLWLENQTTNIILNTKTFSGWAASGVTVATGKEGHYDLTSAALLSVVSVGNPSFKRYSFSSNVTGANFVSGQIKLKKATARYARLQLSESGVVIAETTIDFDNTVFTSSVEKLADGWNLLKVSGIPALPTTNVSLVVSILSSNMDESYVGSDEQVYIDSPQLEINKVPTSFINTSDSATTRAADKAFIDVSDLVASNGFSVCFTFRAAGSSDAPIVFSTASDTLGSYIGPVLSSEGFRLVSSEGPRTLPVPSFIAENRNCCALSFSSVTLENALCVNGQKASVVEGLSLSPVNYKTRRYLKLGGQNNAAAGTTYIERVAIYPFVLPAEQLLLMSKMG